MVGYILGSNSLVGLGVSLSAPQAVLAIGTVFNVIISSLFLIGIKRTVRFLTVFYILSFAGFILIIVSLLTSSPAAFQANFNSFLARIGSNQTYSGIISAARRSGLSIPAEHLSRFSLP